MDTGISPDVFLFDQFRFDRRGGHLTRSTDDGGLVPVSLGSRALAVLGVLVERAGELVPRDEIMLAVWPATAVEEANLTVQISALRRALDAGREGPSCIVNVPGRGYRFLPEVRRLADPSEPAQVVSTPVPPPRRLMPRTWYKLSAAVFALLLVALLAVASGLFRPQTPPRLSVVVLPFESLTGDPKDNYLVEGITEDITADLSNVPGMFVIARESAYALQGKPIDVRKVGEQFGVRYAVEGSVRKLGDTLRVSAQLVSTETGAHLWADHFDQKLSDLNAGQNAIVSRIGQTLNVAVTDLESARSKRERPKTRTPSTSFCTHARSGCIRWA
jgi:TolB-like protein/DNA-binding winged helix-turn-helix (wHTH) protein